MSLNQLVDIAGVCGFILSLILAISKLLSSRLRVKAGTFTIIDTANVPNSVFLFVTLTNCINVSFSLVDVYIRDIHQKIDIPVEKTVRTYRHRPTNDRLAVKPVVLSQEFPARFEPYDAKVFLLEVSRRRIYIERLRSLPDASIRNPEARPLLQRFRYKLYTRQLPFRLMLNTSRGRLSIPIFVSAVEGWNFLDQYAVQKAAYEEKIAFPE